MNLAKVIGTTTATIKHASLNGWRMLVVQPLLVDGGNDGEPVIAVDNMGSGIGDGNRHNHEDLPIVLAGRGGGTITTGRRISYARNTPICNLYTELLHRMDCDVASFGDSTGSLPGLVS